MDVTALVAEGSTNAVHLAVPVSVDDLGGRGDQLVIGQADISGNRLIGGF